MGGWFGDLDLAYKYTIVFASLLAFTIVAGLIKVFIDRRKLRKLANEKDEENLPREDQMELNRREKDEGDLFGIRAIEAGYFAGIPQSRPTSRAGSIVGGPTMSSTTLVGAAFNSPKFHSTASSVTSLPLAHTYDRRDSDTLPSTTRRPSPPAIRLRPSEAELNGRINHSATVSVVLDVPSSPVHTQSQRFSGSDSGDSDDQTLKSGHYSPVAPQVPMENHLHVAVVPANGAHRSHAASVNDLSPLSSPNCSAPPSPGHRPLSYVPSMPDQLNRDESWTQRPVSYRPEQPTQQTTSEQSGATTILLPRTYEPAHRRKSSDASSIYSEKQTSSAKSTHSRNFSLPSNATRNSVAAPSVRSEESWLPPLPPTNLAPLPSHDAANDPRFSAFYDAYFRNSRLNEGLQFDAHGQGLGISQASTIENENETPEPGIAL